MMSYRNFEYAFVHRFGPHGGEAPHEIIARKREEIKSVGWTLWAFRHRPGFKKAYQVLSREAIKDVYAFSTEGEDGKEPSGETLDCTHYKMIDKMIGSENWERLPNAKGRGIQASQPFKIGKREKIATAFVVREIIHPVDFSSTVEWLNREGKWQNIMTNGVKKLPTIGEYLIRRKQNGASTPNFRVVLELKPPYLAYLKVA